LSASGRRISESCCAATTFERFAERRIHRVQGRRQPAADRCNGCGAPVAEVVAKGEAEIGMQQIDVILPVSGTDYVGPLPAELQGYVDFAVGVLAVSKQPGTAQRWSSFAH
jgi:hypothetical protein